MVADRPLTEKEKLALGDCDTIVELLHVLAGSELMNGFDENWAILLKAGYDVQNSTEDDDQRRRAFIEAASRKLEAAQ